MGIGEPGNHARARSTLMGRVRPRWVIAGCVIGILGVQVAVLSAVPFGWRTAVSSVLPMVMFAGWAAMFVWTMRRRRASMPVPPVPPVLSAPPVPPMPPVLSATESERRAEPPADEVSVRMLLACELARLGAPAVWIAEHCELPVALAELVIADQHGRAQHPDASAG